MQETANKEILQLMIEQLDLPKSIDEKVRDRYKSLSEWFSREDSSLKEIDIFSQGSFALGTTIKPLNDGEEYDLDMGCKVKITGYKKNHSQKDLKDLIGQELEMYRKKVNIQNPMDEKRRCWRLEYKDEVHFHLDIVPCIPLEDEQKVVYEQQLGKEYISDEMFSEEVAHLAVNITDIERENYEEISFEWNISNSQGYVKWFQRKMQQTMQAVCETKAYIEPVPIYTKKTILQRCIQLLKRHRDNMFKDDKDCKPISIIITTLAARAYKGESNIEEAILNILEEMPRYINSQKPRIPNPVKPEEDFTDRWDNPEFSDLKLEENFNRWLIQAKIDFKKLLNVKGAKEVKVILNEGFSLNINEDILVDEYGFKAENKKPLHIVTNPQVQPWRI